MVDQRIGESAESDPEAIRVEATRMMDARIADGEPYLFAQLPSAIAGPDDTVGIGPDAPDADWEAELGVVIGRPAYRVSRDSAMAHVAGYLIVNDITARGHVMRRDMKAIGADWLRAKSQPGFAPIGPWIVPACFTDPMNLRITLRLNGATMQDESTSDMIFDIARQIEYASRYVRLEPGDIIATGSP